MVESRPVEAVLDKVVEKVEETVVELVEAVPDKAVEEVDEVVEKIEETVVELLVEALEVEEIFRQRPQQDTRVSLGPVFNHFGLLGS